MILKSLTSIIEIIKSNCALWCQQCPRTLPIYSISDGSRKVNCIWGI